MLKKIFAFVAIPVLLYSCSTTTKTQSSDFDYMYITKQGIIQKPLITDLEVAKARVTMSRTYRMISMEGAKENIMGEFIQQNACDVIVQPFFTVSAENSSAKTTVNVTLTAYPASYKNIRPYEPKDSLYLIRGLFVAPSKTPLPTNTQTIAPAQKKNIGGKILAGALVAGALVYAASASEGM